VNKFWIIFLIFLAGCGGLRSTRNILPVPETEMTILQRTKGVAVTKNDISVLVVYLQDVKELDGFGIMIVNETPNWISFKKEECILIQDGEVRYPLSDSKASARLGSTYKPKMPNDLIMDISNWRRDINFRSSRGTKVVDENKISIISGSKETVFLYFSTQGSITPMQLIIPNIYNESTKQRTNFSFRFIVERK